MIDTHCHLNLDPLYSDRSKHLSEAVSVGVHHLIIPSTDLDSCHKTIKIVSDFPNCFGALGLHPEIVSEFVSKSELFSIYTSELAKLANSNKIVAIGEIGLDYYHLQGEAELDKLKTLQLDLCRFQLEIAKDLNLPVILHVREAQQDILDLIKTYRPKGVLHCFAGDKDYLSEALDLGLYISFAGNVTFKNAAELAKLALETPNDRILIETDAPFLNPIRGQFPNVPKNVAITAEFLRELKQLTLQEFTKITDANTVNLFKLDF
jgi:TatD DNase family protein